MFTHELLSELASSTIAIQRGSEGLRADVLDKGSEGKDVVSGSDLNNEAELRKLLKKSISGLAFIYGEEYGFERTGQGTVGAIIDPIDGTRAYTGRIFYSAVSVAFVNLQGQTLAGYIISINNQWPDQLEAWTFDGETTRKNGETYFPRSAIDRMERACISITSVAAFPRRSQEIAARLFRLATERSRGPLSFCSGAMEILSVLGGNLGACINIGEEDVVSHAVALAIAKNAGFHVRHVFTGDDDFDLVIDMEKGTVTPKVSASLAICPAAFSAEFDRLLADAVKM